MIYGFAALQILINSGFLWLAFRQKMTNDDMLFRVVAANRSLDLLWGKQGMRDGEVVEAITGNLDAELEKSAVMTEIRQAKRRTLPREDAGPPATVRRMKFYRGK